MTRKKQVPEDSPCTIFFLDKFCSSVSKTVSEFNDILRRLLDDYILVFQNWNEGPFFCLACNGMCFWPIAGTFLSFKFNFEKNFYTIFFILPKWHVFFVFELFFISKNVISNGYNIFFSTRLISWKFFQSHWFRNLFIRKKTSFRFPISEQMQNVRFGNDGKMTSL